MPLLISYDLPACTILSIEILCSQQPYKKKAGLTRRKLRIASSEASQLGYKFPFPRNDNGATRNRPMACTQ